MDQATLDQRCINTVRFLAVDAVQKAGSGHPGTPMGAATMAYTLWDRFLKHNPRDPAWPDRDRFILSPGHASMLLYALLHLTGYDLPLEELQNFRQWGSKTPGHPEYRETPGVEMTTGPLGQGFAHGVGMAVAERWLAEHYNPSTGSGHSRPGHGIINHYTYAIVSDGDMQEGVTSEAASLAGTLRLGKLIYLYDDNDIQIEGTTDMTFSECVACRFDAYGWQVIGPIDGHNVTAIEAAIHQAQADTERPSLIICKTVIGLGTGSETHIALEAGKKLAAEGVRVSVVSMPSWKLFDRQPADYRESVLPSAVRARVAVEAGLKLGWEHYVGLDGTVVGMDGFGASAPAEVLYEKFGITTEAVVAQAKALLKR